MLINLRKLKNAKKHTYEVIAKKLDCSRITIQRYFNGTIIIPIDRLIELTKLYKVDLDVLCTKL